MPLKTYFQRFVLPTSKKLSEGKISNLDCEDQRSSLKDKGQKSNNFGDEHQSSNPEDEHQSSNLGDEHQSSNLEDGHQSLSLEGKGRILTEDQSIPMEEGEYDSDLEIIDFVSSSSYYSRSPVDKLPLTKSPTSQLSSKKAKNEQLSTPTKSLPVKISIDQLSFTKSPTNHLSSKRAKNEQLSSPNCSTVSTLDDQVSVTNTMSSFLQLSPENIKSENLSTVKPSNKNRKSIKGTVQRATTQSCNSDQMSQPNCHPIKQEIKKEREEEDDITIDESTLFVSDPNMTTQNDQMSLVKCPNEETESLSFPSNPNTTTTHYDQMPLTNCPSDEEDIITFEESSFFLSSLKTEESQIKTSETSETSKTNETSETSETSDTSNNEFPSFLDDSLQLSESLSDTSMETSGKHISK
jgi:hypothetical protein